MRARPLKPYELQVGRLAHQASCADYYVSRLPEVSTEVRAETLADGCCGTSLVGRYQTVTPYHSHAHSPRITPLCCTLTTFRQHRRAHTQCTASTTCETRLCWAELCDARLDRRAGGRGVGGSETVHRLCGSRCSSTLRPSMRLLWHTHAREHTHLSRTRGVFRSVGRPVRSWRFPCCHITVRLILSSGRSSGTTASCRRCRPRTPLRCNWTSASSKRGGSSSTGT